MKKIIVLHICILFFSSLNAQIKGIPVEGKCSEVIRALRTSLKNDTLAANHFKDNYTITHISKANDIYKMDVSEVITFLSDTTKSKSCKCHIRGWRERNVLPTE